MSDKKLKVALKSMKDSLDPSDVVCCGIQNKNGDTSVLVQGDGIQIMESLSAIIVALASKYKDCEQKDVAKIYLKTINSLVRDKLEMDEEEKSPLFVGRSGTC